MAGKSTNTPIYALTVNRGKHNTARSFYTYNQNVCILEFRRVSNVISTCLYSGHWHAFILNEEYRTRAEQERPSFIN